MCFFFFLFYIGPHHWPLNDYVFYSYNIIYIYLITSIWKFMTWCKKKKKRFWNCIIYRITYYILFRFIVRSTYLCKSADKISERYKVSFLQKPIDFYNSLPPLSICPLRAILINRIIKIVIYYIYLLHYKRVIIITYNLYIIYRY